MQNQWLIPFDGSDHSLRAVDLAISEARARSVTPALLLLNVQSPLPTDITRFIDRKTVDDYHREQSEKLLTLAKEQLAASGLTFTSRILVGEVAATIVEMAQREGCTMIVMGAHGHGRVEGVLMGSVTTKVLQQTPLPVLLVK